MRRHREPGGRTVSFRFLLAVRVTLALTGAVTAVALLSYFALRQTLDRELEEMAAAERRGLAQLQTMVHEILMKGEEPGK